MTSQILKLSNGRQLGYELVGEGKPVVYFHGTASSRLEILLLEPFAEEFGFRLIGIDRPGYGLSTYTRRPSLREFAPDVNAIANHLHLDKFLILGWSGGGPFALTYTALNPDRVERAVVVGAPALPFDPSTAHNNNPLAKFAMKTPYLANWGLYMFRKSVLNANHDIEAYLKSRAGKNMVAQWPQSDARFFADPTWLKLMYVAMAEGFRQGDNSINTIYQEHQLFLKPWNEPLDQIPAGKLTLWQGENDKTCPVHNADKIAETAKTANVAHFPHEGHCLMFAKPQKLAEAFST